MPVPPFDTSQIVVTASRVPQPIANAPASVTVLDGALIERIGEPLVPGLLRLVPSTSVSVSGPPGSLTEVRIRGAEANHSLLFIDGIRANDPATGDQPRFDLLNADIASRIEVVRGPQSALWGSDAIGGVIAINGTDVSKAGYSAAAEAGSLGFERGSASLSVRPARASIAAAVGWQQATGIDSFDGHGDKDGYRNLSARLSGTYQLAPGVKLGAAGFALAGRSDFDGFDPLTFLHADTLDKSRNRMAAGRLSVDLGSKARSWSGQVSASLLGSSNRNYLGNAFLNRTSGTRRTLDAQVEHRFSTGAVESLIVAAAEGERETFTATDTAYGGATDQVRSRSHDSVTVEWRPKWHALSADLALRRDVFDRFKDATTVRASLLADLGAGFAISGDYAEGIAQPTFFDLYGFYPGSFAGNHALNPESSRGFEMSARYKRGRIQAALTGYRQRLKDEIVDTYDPGTFVSSTANGNGTSRRSGVEAELHWRLGDAMRLSATYAYLHATQPSALSVGQVREVRRPRHSGSIAIDGVIGRFTYGAAMAYTGARPDTDFDMFPARNVTLHAYWLADARIAYRVTRSLELFLRTANAFNAHYEDAVGYRTEGRTAYAGIRLAGG